MDWFLYDNNGLRHERVNKTTDAINLFATKSFVLGNVIFALILGIDESE